MDPAAALNAVSRLQRHRLVSDLAYSDGARNRLDLYLPVSGSSGGPIILFLYGGSWNSGAKESYRFVGAALAARGFVALIPDYRLYPQARFPAFLEDAAQAIRWARDNAARFGADPSRLFVMGHSAGAHMAAMLAFDRRWLGAVGLSPARDLAGVVGLAGPYHFAIDTDLLRGVFGSPANADATQPLSYVTREAPPLLLATGDADQTVRPRNTRELADAVRRAGGDVRTILYPHLAHREIVAALSPMLSFLAPVADDVAAFISTRAKPADNREERRERDREESRP